MKSNFVIKTSDGMLTGCTRMRIGVFGIMIYYVQVFKENGDIIWRSGSNTEFKKLNDLAEISQKLQTKYSPPKKGA